MKAKADTRIYRRKKIDNKFYKPMIVFIHILLLL